MKIKKYLKDKLFYIGIILFSYILILLLFFAFKVNKQLIISVSVIIFFATTVILLIDFFRKKEFYTNLLENIKVLDKAYLVLETLKKPEFYEGQLLYEALYEIDKSMNENVRKMQESLLDFKEYIEMWIHEVKIPLATISLMSNNQKRGFDKRAKMQLKKLEDYVDQVLYYARSENAEKDYLIKQTNLTKVIKNVGLKNMDDLLEHKIDYIVQNANVKVLTDSKWLEFILEQIINNSIKYKKNIKSSYIKITTIDDDLKTVLIIEDNGIGIKQADLKQVFDKSFTGENGRDVTKSTGMGLFIAKKMCEKLGHKIDIESIYNEFTKVYITFAKNKFYDVLK